MDVPETTGVQATPTAAKEANVGGGAGDKSQVNTPQAAGPISRYPGVPSVGGATAGGISTPQAGGGVRQVCRFLEMRHVVQHVTLWEVWT